MVRHWLASRGVLLLGILNTAAHAEDVAPDTAQRQFWLEPSVTLRYTASSNARVTPDAESNQLLEMVPALRAVAATAHIQGFLDYSLRGVYYSKDVDAKHVFHQLNTNFTLQAAEGHAHLDVMGVSALEPVSVFGAPVSDLPSNANTAQLTNFRVSPSWRGRLGGVAEYELRYAMQDTRSSAQNNTHIQTQNVHLGVGDFEHKTLLGWRVDAEQQSLNYFQERRFDNSMLEGKLRYLPMPQLAVFVIGGFDSTNQMMPERETTSIVGGALEWQPSVNSRVSLERTKRYFGNAYNVQLEHRMGHAIFSYKDNQNISLGQGSAAASMGALYDLLSAAYEPVEADPVRRAQLVNNELQRLGLPANFQITPNFIQANATVQRIQQLSMALTGRRSTATLSFLQSNNERLNAAIPVAADDFLTNSSIRQRGWNLILAHRLTPRTGVNVSWSDLASVGASPGFEARAQTLSMGMVSLLGPRTSLGLQLRHSLFYGVAGAYRESAAVATLVHKF